MGGGFSWVVFGVVAGFECFTRRAVLGLLNKIFFLKTKSEFLIYFSYFLTLDRVFLSSAYVKYLKQRKTMKKKADTFCVQTHAQDMFQGTPPS